MRAARSLVFTEAMLDYMEDNYCIDTERVFATDCLYGPASGHQIPSYFTETTMDWFRSF